MEDLSFYNFRGHLAQFRPLTGQQEYWEERWAERNISEILESYRTGKLDEFEDVFIRYLVKDLPVLEAGCGQGQLVIALNSRGYQIEGVDYAANTVTRIQTIAPELKLRVGNIYNLDVPDGTYGGYISIGIFEHNPDGPLEGLREVRRVLHPDGVAFITVPYLNRERQKWLRKVPVAVDIELPNHLKFYQYYFSVDEFKTLLHDADLETIEVYPYGVYSGLTRDFRLGRWLHFHSFFSWQFHKRITKKCREAPQWARWQWSHMLMFICKKRNGSLVD